MTAKEALKEIECVAEKLAYWSRHDISELDDDYNFTNLFLEVHAALNELEKLKAKEIAIKPIKIKLNGSVYWQCPNENYFTSPYERYCSECGHRLDWGDE